MNELFGEENKLPDSIRQQYVNALGSPEQQVRSLTFARELVGVSRWYEELWQKRKSIQDIPTLILWGERDKLVKIEALQKWKRFFHECYVIHFEDSGHFLQEENAEELASYVSNFIKEEQKKREPSYQT